MPHRLFSVAIAATLLAWAQPALAQPEKVPSFVNDVEPILTRLGCNQGACHGKSAGQNGFRLSLRGYAPEWDHAWITREFAMRRINPANPEASLFLLKPTGQTAHEGGVLMSTGSRAYKVLLAWLRGGAPGVNEADPSVRRLMIASNSPRPLGEGLGVRDLKAGDTLQLVVRAQYSDGQIKDVTWLTKFTSNDSSVASVSPTGLVKLERAGETPVRAMFAGQVAVIVLTAPHEAPVKAEWYTGRNNFIDNHVFKKLADLRIEPSALCSDNVFIRRVYLDAMGVLPAPREVRAFLADKGADKRAKLIDRVLERPEFVDYWTMQMNDLLMNRKESDHDVRGVKGVRGFHAWIRAQVANNRPWDEMTRDILTVTGTTNDHPVVGYYIVNVGEERESHRSTVVANAAQTFLGVRIGCAKCHNHPLEKYTQDDYYRFAGYFSRIRLDRKDPKTGPTTLTVSLSDPKQNKNPVGVTQPRTNKFLAPQPLDRAIVKIDPGEDPRKVLADWVTDPKNEYFAGAMVNRLWAHFFNVGLVEPIDDLRDSNPPTNPELWKALVKEFIAKKFDRKHIMRLILNSRAYQLSAATKPAIERDHRFYSHYYVRRLPAEVIHDAIYALTGIADQFDGYPLGLRAVQIPDVSLQSSALLDVFRRPERLTACACERNSEVNLTHTLHLLGSDGNLGKIAAPDGRLAHLLKMKMSDQDLVQELMMIALSRPLKDDERKVITNHLANVHDRRLAFEEIMWALINTKEFIFNH